MAKRFKIMSVVITMMIASFGTGSSHCEAAIIQFEDFAHPGGEVSIAPPGRYEETGFFVMWDTTQQPADSMRVLDSAFGQKITAHGQKTDIGFWQSGAQAIVLGSTTGEAFSIQSVDLGQTFGESAGVINVFGFQSGGSELTTIHFVTQSEVFTTLLFPDSWTELELVAFRQAAASNFNAIDTIVLNEPIAPPAPVPEPSSVAIWSLLAGVALAVGIRRRLKAASHLQQFKHKPCRS